MLRGMLRGLLRGLRWVLRGVRGVRRGLLRGLRGMLRGLLRWLRWMLRGLLRGQGRTVGWLRSSMRSTSEFREVAYEGALDRRAGEDGCVRRGGRVGEDAAVVGAGIPSMPAK